MSNSGAPFWYREFPVNGQPSQVGIDSVTLKAGDVVGFSPEMYTPEKNPASTLHAKHAFQIKAARQQ